MTPHQEPIRSVLLFCGDRPGRETACRAAAEALSRAGVDHAPDHPDPDAILTVGGDGTLLAAVHRFRDLGRPFLAINAGHLGFLAAAPLGEIDQVLDHMAQGTFFRVSAPMLRVAISGDGREETLMVLNDVVMERQGTRTLSFALSSEGLDLEPIVGDGVLVASPLGSTGYAYAAGGAILHPEARGYQVLGLNLHTSRRTPGFRGPLVLPAASDLTIRNLRPEDREARVVVDGRAMHFDLLYEIHIHWADEEVDLLYLPSYRYLHRVAEVLWTVQPRGGPA